MTNVIPPVKIAVVGASNLMWKKKGQAFYETPRVCSCPGFELCLHPDTHISVGSHFYNYAYNYFPINIYCLLPYYKKIQTSQQKKREQINRGLEILMLT